jgi:adenosylhomocysteine nucleosidase
VKLLFFFAVPPEAGIFRMRYRQAFGVPPLLSFTGMGPGAAHRAGTRMLESVRPDRVISCGFAGGLRPDLRPGDLVADGSDWPDALPLPRNVNLGRFYGATRVATTRAEKNHLHALTNADAVEMESSVLRDLCRARGIPILILRAISDSAEEDLPIDFNPLIRPDGSLNWLKLMRTVVGQPGRIPALLRLQRRSHQAAGALAESLLFLLRNR